MLEPPTYKLAIFADHPTLFHDGRAEVVLKDERVAKEALEKMKGDYKMAKCRICGRGVQTCTGWLERVNETGVDGIWECRPACEVELSQADKLLGATAGDDA